MSVLVIADGLSNPSTLWMRRQLEMIGDDITYLVTDFSSARNFSDRYNVIVERKSDNKLVNRLLHFLNLLRLFIAIHNKHVKIIFIHYATIAVKYKKLLDATNKKIVVHCHGYDVTWKNPTHGKSYVKQLTRLPDNVSFIANSNITKQRLVDIGINSNRVSVKYLGIDTQLQPVIKAPRPKDQQIILFLGRLIDFKGPDLVIRAFEKSCSQGLQGKLIIAGDGPLRPTCEQLQSQSPYSNRIEMLGAIDEHAGRELRENADIFTAHNCKGPVTNQEEAFGVTMIEAMSSGLPIVNTYSGSIPELIEDGRSGILVDPGDIDAHARALIRLQNDDELRASIIKNAWDTVQTRFSLERERDSLRRILNLNRNR